MNAIHRVMPKDSTLPISKTNYCRGSSKYRHSQKIINLRKQNSIFSQIGNAVPCDLAYAVGAALQDILKSEKL